MPQTPTRDYSGTTKIGMPKEQFDKVFRRLVRDGEFENAAILAIQNGCANPGQNRNRHGLTVDEANAIKTLYRTKYKNYASPMQKFARRFRYALSGLTAVAGACGLTFLIVNIKDANKKAEQRDRQRRVLLDTRTRQYESAHNITATPRFESVSTPSRAGTANILPAAAVTEFVTPSGRTEIDVIDGAAFHEWITHADASEPLVEAPQRCGDGVLFRTTRRLIYVVANRVTDDVAATADQTATCDGPTLRLGN